MTTVAELIEETKRHLYSGQNEEMNRLNGAIITSDTVINLKYDLGGIQPGSIIAVELEEIRVWETSGKQITVCERGVNGSTAANHATLTAVIAKPKFTNFRILKALNDDLNDLSSPVNGMYQVRTTTLTFNAAVEGYDLVGSDTYPVMGIIDVDYDYPGPARDQPMITSWALRRNTNTGVFPSGNSIVVYEGGFPGQSIRVRYRSPFGHWTATTDTEVTVGLPTTAIDIPPLGAAVRLVAPRDVKRSFSEAQGEPRRAEEVPVGSAGTAMRGMMMLRQSRILAEAARLESQYPKAMM